MSRQDQHDGVSCDGCAKENFRGRRYKCLVCFDYDLCATCFDQGHMTQRHTSEHPMQCILTTNDYDLYYGGENNMAPERYPQSLACPFCRRIGFSEITLREHVSSDHSGVHTEVVCPLCAAMPNGEPNHMTDDLANHLSVEHLHREPPSLPEEQHQRHAPRRTPAISSRGGGLSIRGSRRANNVMSGFGGSAFGRESVDPIAELLSQLGGIRRAGSAYSSTFSQIQQLQQAASRQAPRRTLVTTVETQQIPGSAANVISVGGGGSSSLQTNAGGPSTLDHVLIAQAAAAAASSNNAEDTSRYLLPTLFETRLTDEQRANADTELTNHSLFVQDLFMSMLPTTTTRDLFDDVARESDSSSSSSSGSSRSSGRVCRGRGRKKC